MQNHYDLIELIDFTDLFEISVDGYSCRLVLMWKQEELHMDPVAIRDQEIQVNVQVGTTTNTSLLSLVYASTLLVNRKILWNNLEIVGKNNTLSWLLCGDFNEVTNGSEKFGGRPSTIIELLPSKTVWITLI